MSEFLDKEDMKRRMADWKSMHGETLRGRRGRRCVVGSITLHGLIVLVAVLGPAFFRPKKTDHFTPVLEFVSPELVDQVLAPSPAPARQQSPPRPRPEPRQETPPPARQQPNSEPETSRDPTPSNEPAPKPEPKVISKPKQRIIPNTTVVRPSTTVTPSQAQQNRAREQARAVAEAERRRREALREAVERAAQKTLSSVADRFSPVTTVATSGPDSARFSDYRAKVRQVYDRAWVEPTEGENPRASVRATIVILKSGKVKSASVSRASGDGTLDASVRRALDAVKFVAPFPSGATDSERTFTISFTLESRR